jgi:nodulation protein E
VRDVAITGLGCVSAAGFGADALWSAARDGKTCVRPIRLPRDVGLSVGIAAQLPEGEPATAIPMSELASYDPFSQFAVLAAEEAVTQAGLGDELRGPRTACIVGSGIGGFNTQDDGFYAFYGEKQRRVHPLTVPRSMPSAAASHVGMRHGAQGPTFAVSSACSSGAQAIGVGFDLIRAGVVDRAIVGGSEACITPCCMRAWEVMRVLSPDASRPFSKGRNGMVLGEGAGVLVLEAADVARARGATILARLLGYGTSSDARDLLRPDPDGSYASMRNALASAGIEAEDVDYVNAHGTGTVLNDAAEAEAIHRVFGARTDRLAVSSTKPIHGHALGASGALELVLTIMALQNQCVPPTVNFLEADPNCRLDVVPNEARRMQVRVALSNSFAFGGINASLVVGSA